MAFQYGNRVGRTYYLREGKTEAGRSSYFFTLREGGKGEAIESIPEGYEIYEHPENAQVFLRKKRLRLITVAEERLVRERLSNLESSKQRFTNKLNNSIARGDCLEVPNVCR